MKDKDQRLLEEAYGKINALGDQPDPEGLRKYIQAKNAETQAWIDEDPKNRGAGMPVEDPEFWKEYGIFNVPQYIHYELVSDVFEAIRSHHGYKPNWGHLNSLSDEELKEERDKIYAQLRAEREQEEQEKREFKQKRNEAKKPLDNSLAQAFDKVKR
jgi:hypothetical protein